MAKTPIYDEPKPLERGPIDSGPTLTGSLPTDDYKRVQETQGPDPTPLAVEPTTRAEQVTVAANEPYPEGSPWAPPTPMVPHNAEKPEWYEPIPPVARGR